MKRALFLFFVMLAISNGSHASGYLTPLGAGVTINKYHVHGEGGVTLWVSGISNPDGCDGTTLVHIPSTLPAYKTMVAAVMVAHATGKKIGLHGTHCSTILFWGGTVTYPIVGNAWVTD